LLRWGLLASVVAIVQLNPTPGSILPDLFPLLVAVAIANLAVTILLSFRSYSPMLSAAMLVIDVVFVLVLPFVSGGLQSPFFFLAVFPISVAALRFGWQIGAFTAFVFGLDMVLHVALAWNAALGISQFLEPSLYLLLFLLTAAIAGALSQGILAQLYVAGSWTGAAQDDRAAPDRFKLAYEMASAMSATLNYQRVLDAILDVSRLGFDDLGLRAGESVGLVLLYDNDGRLCPASYRNLVVSMDETRCIPGTKGIVGEAIGSAQAIIGGAAANDPELRAFESLRPAKSVVCVPLRAGFETYGVVLFASVKRGVYDAEHADLLTIYCNQATIALQNASLYRSLREERDKIINKEEEARHKLARELHDGPTQDVAAIAMRLNFARLLVERDPGRAKAELERLEDLAHRTVKEIRSMLFTLRPIILETEGLVAALNQYADGLREADGLPIIVEAERYRDCLDPEVQGVVFAILEEAINNARKHAQASVIRVRLGVERDLFLAQVMDNGSGFDVQAVEKTYGARGSLGILNLKERAELVGGTLKVESAPGRGTRITLLVPLQEGPA
jgi:signal transduction histidine kinase